MADRIFKGATRPAMMAGVPIVPFVLVAGFFIMLSMWLMLFFGFVWLGVGLLCGAMSIGGLRYISSQDDQKLNQYILYFMSWPHRRRNSEFWKAHSMSPCNYTKRK